MTESTGQTGTEESTGTAQAAPPPFHVPDGSTCVADCDDAPLGWSTPTVGATNLPTGAQGGGGDMIGCWQVAQTADPHGDSETSGDEEIMQLYVSADGSGSNEGLWFRVRDGSFTSWTSLSRTGTLTGTIIDFAGSSAPAGYLVCNGAADFARHIRGLVRRYRHQPGAMATGAQPSTCPICKVASVWALIAAIVAPGSTGGGEEEVALNTSHMPVHSHSDGTLATTSGGSHSHGAGSYAAASAGSHSHGNKQYAGGNSGGALYDIAEQRGGTNYAIQNTESAGSHTHSITGYSSSAGSHSHGVTGSTGSRGSGQPHDNIPHTRRSLRASKRNGVDMQETMD